MTWVRLWPWITSVAAALIVDLIIGALRHFDFYGINGFSTFNYGWLAFTLVGGVVFAWRVAGPPADGWIILRMFVAPVTAFVLCYLLKGQTALFGQTGQIFITRLSFIDLWQEALKGQLLLRDIFVWASMAVFFLFLSVKVLETRRWS